MPADNNRKIISLETLTEFKNKYDQYVANNFAPLTGNPDVNWGTGSLTVGAINIGNTTLGQDDEVSLFAIGHSGKIQINNTANGNYSGVEINTPGLLTYNGVEVATKSDISSVLRFKGNATIEQLNGTADSGNIQNPNAGDTYNITAAGLLDNVGPSHTNDFSVNAGDNVAWVQPSSGQGYWDVLAGTLDTSNFVTNSQLSTTLSGYLPLSAGSTKALTGELHVKPDMGIIGASIVAPGGVLSLQGETNVVIKAGITNDATMTFKSKKFVFANSTGAIYPSTTIVARSDDKQANTLQLPTEDGTLVTGEYATTGEVQALFN
jgi:hypothetical protein